MLGLGEVVAAVGVLDGVVMLGVGVEGVEGKLNGEGTGVAGAGLPAELGEGTADDLSGDDGVGNADGEVTGDGGTVVLKDGTKPGHLPQVICSTMNDQLSIEFTEICTTHTCILTLPDSTPGVVLVLGL